MIVASFPDVTSQSWVVSTGNNSSDAVWSWDSRELFYRDHDAGVVMRVPIDSEAAAPVGGPEPLFEDTYFWSAAGPHYDVAEDGRFLMMQDANLEPPREIVVHRNWIEELKERVPIP